MILKLKISLPAYTYIQQIKDQSSTDNQYKRTEQNIIPGNSIT
ncbi:MAG: hypothetical protein AAFN10_28075 [Bacteroidota bacterium]